MLVSGRVSCGFVHCWMKDDCQQAIHPSSNNEQNHMIKKTPVNILFPQQKIKEPIKKKTNNL